MQVVTVPVLSDNYAYLLIDEASGTAAAVDPVEPDKLMSAADTHGVRITAVLCTHRHADHAGGNAEIARRIDGLRVFGGEHDAIPAATDPVSDGQTLEFGSIAIRCLHTPFHTPGHVCFHCTDGSGKGPGVVFTGDTLFVSGCGRINGRGTAEQMKRALVDVLGALPEDTLAYVGHEYTAANLSFARAVEPGSEALAATSAWAEGLIAEGRPTVPTTIGRELASNPFLRPHSEEVRAYVRGAKGEAAVASDVAVLGALRELKNGFGLGAVAGTR